MWTAAGRRRRRRTLNALVDRRSTAGLILVVLGLMLLAAHRVDFTGAAVLGVLSVFFLVVMYASTRSYGSLFQGILGGLGAGMQEYGYDPSGGIVVLGHGASFIATRENALA
jgi:heme O synthase-like polyprenyltransferase